jgi:hypothetical protein
VNTNLAPTGTTAQTLTVAVKELRPAWNTGSPDVFDLVLTGPTRTGNAKKVKDINVGPKSALVTFEDGSKARWDRSAPVEILRQELTDDEIARRKRDDFARTLIHRVEAGSEDKARALLDKAIAAVDEGKSYEYLTGWNLGDIVEKQAVRNVYLRIKGSYDSIRDKGLVSDTTAILAAFGYTYARIEQSTGRSPWNLSTSTGSNLIEATERWAYGDVLDRVTGWHFRTEEALAVFAEAIAEYESARATADASVEV